jgi:hypothetical protein
LSKNICLFVAIAATATLGACAVATAPGYIGPDVQLTAVTKRQQHYRGFSVRPPTSSGWTVRVSEQSPLRATYRLTLPSKTHTFVAGASLIQIDTKLPVEEALVPSGVANTGRTQVLESSHQADTTRKTTCIRYSIRLRDTGTPNSPDAALEMIDRGLVCAHPTMPGLAVRASFSERGLPQELDPSLWAGFEEFLRGIQIESAPGVPAV